MTKTIAFKQPNAPARHTEAEDWVKASPAILSTATAAPTVVMSRMTFDVPKSLHMRFKMQCLRRDKHEYELGTQIMERAVAELEKE